jgi:23S rRNA (pseudouridine1915-N3)-methyltransferase
VRLIDNQQGAVFARERTHTVEVARLRQHNADVCQSGLDEHGRDLDSARLAARLTAWQEDARPVALIIGGPDGVDASIRSAAEETLRLSSLTLPHAMVRVLLAEQLYRAWSINAGHPYHRE